MFALDCEHREEDWQFEIFIPQRSSPRAVFIFQKEMGLSCVLCRAEAYPQ